MKRKIINELKIQLPRKKLNWFKIFFFCCSFSISFLYIIISIWILGLDIFYKEIYQLLFFLFMLLTSILTGYGLLNTLYQHPILLLTTSNIFIGTSRFLRPFQIKDTGISPYNDMKLLLVKDSASQRFWLMLEGRRIIDLGLFTTIEEAENKRNQIKIIMSKYYPYVLISCPIYREI